MRIGAGKLRGRRLFYPRAGLRPTKDITRQAIFNIVGRQVRGARVCDLYAGGGALGIEALSRGAAEVVFVERNPAFMKLVRKNASGAGACRFIVGEVPKALAKLGASRFDLVIADPPYRQGLVQPTIDRAAELDLVQPGGLLVIEHHKLEPPSCPEGWELVRQGHYGESEVTVLRRQGEGESDS